MYEYYRRKRSLNKTLLCMITYIFKTKGLYRQHRTKASYEGYKQCYYLCVIKRQHNKSLYIPHLLGNPR